MSSIVSALRSFWAKYWILVFVVVGASGWFFARTFVIEPFRAPSDSMAPTLPSGSYLWVRKWGFGNYRFFAWEVATGPMRARIERGDLLTFALPTDPRSVYLKRVIGLPGDRIEYVDRELRLNGEVVPLRWLAEGSGAQVYEERLNGIHRIQHYPGLPFRPFVGTVPPGHYFVLGDNRDSSRDSRFPEVGYIPQARLVGEVAWIVYRGPES